MDPTLVELDKQADPNKPGDRTAYFSDGSTLVFPIGTTFKPEQWDHKVGQRITPPDDVKRRSFVIIQGCTRATVEAAIRICEGK